mmetsp:Transcript_15048/g.50963  ORF Transcript_15048/g.50963 Transcript_15048/m.50963 type:complete len:204 (+) Transcript_15048:910-1521(+)|eukprot:CAMPEP_0198423904 /NCGR_PEP_ID=MMETSP1452-20131203/3432_1 /TAXON_ID=1181717 /ORGANISM="Synchroma pusillum, Strain CCMP3072" /LENGTH=203 /DNA_ID=CAMNT_0044144229 /DNA_START=67 /DNA_END=678 /DNA_ORIENTATION=+
MMKTVAVLALGLATASAFMMPAARSGVRARSTTPSMLIGGDVETGGVWDPVGYSRIGSEESLYRRRCVELKHGRVSMLAVLGVLVQSSGIHLPSSDGVFSYKKPLEAFYHFVVDNPLGAAQLLAGIAAIEILFPQDPSKAPGDLGSFGDNFKPADEEDYERLQLAEIKNGRLAMIAIMAELTQENLSGVDVLTQLSSGPFSPQ